MLLLRQCGGFCRLIHLARTIPPSLAGDALSLFDDEVWQCFAECTAVDTPDFTWQQAQLSLTSAVSSGLSHEVCRYLHHSIDLYNNLVDPPDSLTPDSVDNSCFTLTQKFLSNKIEDCQFKKLFDNSTPIDRARLLSISSPHASAWLSVTPSPNMGLHLEPSEFQRWVGGLTHPADVLVPNWVLGKPAAFDLSVTSMLNAQIFQEACVIAGSAALAAQIRKHRVNDERCRDLGWACIPLVVRMYGCWGTEAILALSRLATRTSQVTREQ
ncbi:hypothetical protein EMCRGX_G011876 [Ephydatia muelleri]